MIEGGGDDLHQMKEGLPHPQVEIEGHLRGHHPQVLVAAVKEEEIEMAAIFERINHRALLGQFLEALQIAGVNLDPGERGVQGMAQ